MCKDINYEDISCTYDPFGKYLRLERRTNFKWRGGEDEGGTICNPSFRLRRERACDGTLDEIILNVASSPSHHLNDSQISVVFFYYLCH